MHRDPIKSAARTLEVLELFNEVRTPLRLHEVITRLNYPQSSSTALLKSMVMLGYLNFHRATRTYFPTTRVSALGDWINTVIYGSGKLLRLQERIHERTGLSTTIASQNDLFVQYNRTLAKPEDRVRIPPPEGFMRLLHCSTGGLVLLSRMNDKAVEKLVRHINAFQASSAERVDLKTLKDELAWIRREGYSFMTGFPTPEIGSLAFPLPDVPHSIPLAIGVGALNHVLAQRKGEVIAIVREMIAEYEHDLVDHAAPAEGADADADAA